MGLSSRDVLWILKKRLEEEWGRAAGGQEGNGMESPFRRRKTELCVKSLWQSLAGSPQCYHSPAALGQGADNPPRELRGGSSTAGMEQHSGVCAKHDTAPSEAAPLGKAWALPRLYRLGEKLLSLHREGCRGCECSKNQRVPVCWAFICSSVSLHRTCSSWGCLFGFQGKGRDHLRVSLWN